MIVAESDETDWPVSDKTRVLTAVASVPPAYPAPKAALIRALGAMRETRRQATPREVLAYGRVRFYNGPDGSHMAAQPMLVKRLI